MLAARVAAAALALTACGRERTEPAPTAAPETRALARLVHHLARAAPRTEAAHVTLTGRVLDAAAQPVAGVQVVARGPGGEVTATSGADGAFRLVVQRGEQRVFVSDPRVMTATTRQRPRIHGAPRAVTAGVPDDALLPRFDATTDLDGLDLRVARVATIRGRTLDPNGAPLRGAIVRADCVERPVLGTDVALTDERGEFALRVPDGARCVLDATHASFAGTRDSRELTALADRPVYSELWLETGCIVTGKVVDARGEPAGDGAIERREVGVSGDFGPAGQIDVDGTFRWETASPGQVRVRAWPWGSPPSNTRTFICDGTRVDDVVFFLGDQQPDLHGVLLDRAGAPVPFAYLDMIARSADGIGQQERTDAHGRWRIYDVPPGPYELRVHVPGAGIVVSSLTAPDRAEQSLRLGGTARLTGTTTSLAEGSFELGDLWCSDLANDRFYIEEPPRLVAVHGGTFTIDGLPGCKLHARARWHAQEVTVEADLSSGAVAAVELALGAPRTKHVRGVVRDADGKAVARATVSARTQDVPVQVVVTGDDGAYALDVVPGTMLRASAGRRGAPEREVGPANVDDERIDLVVR